MKSFSTTKAVLITNLSAIIISLALIICTIIGAYSFYESRLGNVLSVTGSAKQTITSDHVRWSPSFSRTVTEDNLKGGYDQMNKDLSLVKAFFNKNGIADADLVITPIAMNQVYKNNDNAPTEYTLQQSIELNSSDVQKITELSKNTNDLINQGILFSNNSVEYSYNDLANLRVTLLGDALKDAMARADSLANTSGKHVGSLQSASSGVVQVLAPNSVEVSDYGEYDTSSIDKEVMVTVKASFSLR